MFDNSIQHRSTRVFSRHGCKLTTATPVVASQPRAHACNERIAIDSPKHLSDKYRKTLRKPLKLQLSFIRSPITNSVQLDRKGLRQLSVDLTRIWYPVNKQQNRCRSDTYLHEAERTCLGEKTTRFKKIIVICAKGSPCRGLLLFSNSFFMFFMFFLIIYFPFD